MTASPSEIVEIEVSSTSSPITRVLGGLTIVGVAFVAVMGLVVSPPDVVQRDAVRLLYIHVPIVTWMYVATFICSLASAMWLRKRTDGWDTLAGAAGELAAVLTALGLVTGMLWGRPTWGVYWVWDARLTSTAMLMVLLLGFLALRRYPVDPDTRARMSAVLGLLLVPNAMIVHYSVDWWRSLHQDATVSKMDVSIDDTMLFTLMAAFAVATIGFTWLLIHRFRVGWLERRAEGRHLDEALAARRADEDTSAGISIGGEK